MWLQGCRFVPFCLGLVRLVACQPAWQKILGSELVETHTAPFRGLHVATGGHTRLGSPPFFSPKLKKKKLEKKKKTIATRAYPPGRDDWDELEEFPQQDEGGEAVAGGGGRRERVQRGESGALG